MLKVIGLLILVGLIVSGLSMLRHGTRAGQQLRIIRRYHSSALLKDKSNRENS
jgi:hypothetical protein